MKIIKGPNPWSRQLTCTRKDCGTIIEINVSDIKTGYFGGDYIEPGVKKYYVECPTCGKALVLDKLPSHVINRIQREPSQGGTGVYRPGR